MTSGEHIEVWRERDGFWRWRYRNDEGVDLLSNESHLTREEAVHSASVAYPGVPIVDRPPGPPGLGLGRTVRFAVLGESSKITADSSTDWPAKTRNSTSLAATGSTTSTTPMRISAS